MPAFILIAGFAGLFVNHFRADTLPLRADWSIQTHKITADGKRLDILLVEAKKLFAKNGVVFIDARSSEAFESGHIAGARSLPWHDVEQQLLRRQKIFRRIPRLLLTATAKPAT